MSRRWRGRTLSHELAITRLSGRPLFWDCSHLFRHRQRASCVDQGGVIVSTLIEKSVIPLFDRMQHHFSVPNRLEERSPPWRSCLLWLVHRCSLCALRATQRPIGHRPMCGQTVDQVVVPLSIYRRSCRSRTTCSCTSPARPDRNDPDLASS
jgi:hypothetical protein